MSDVQQLASWRLGPVDAGFIDLGDGCFRPRDLIAVFHAADLVVVVQAIGDADGVRVVESSFRRAADLGGPPVELGGGDAARFDLALAATQLEKATRIRWFDEMQGAQWISFGSGPAMAVPDVRRFLAGPGGPTKTGPRSKVPLERVAKVWRTAARKGNPSTRAVAEALGVSASTAHRYVNAARKAGLLDKEGS